MDLEDGREKEQKNRGKNGGLGAQGGIASLGLPSTAFHSFSIHSFIHSSTCKFLLTASLCLAPCQAWGDRAQEFPQAAAGPVSPRESAMAL